MPYNSLTNTFTRAWEFVDHRNLGDVITRVDLDAAVDDLVTGITPALDQAKLAVARANFAGRGFDTLQDLLTDVLLTYSSGSANTVVNGDVLFVRNPGMSFSVASSAASDSHVASAGGVKFYFNRPLEYARSFDTLDDFLADADLNYADGETGPVQTGDVIHIALEDYPLLVAAGAAGDAAHETVGGVKVYAVARKGASYAEEFGASPFASAAENDAAFTKAFAWLNGATSRSLFVGGGRFDLTRPLPAIVTSDARFSGLGFEATKFRMDAAQTSGRLLNIGDGAAVVARVAAGGFTFQLQNPTGVSGYVFDVVDADEVSLTDFRGIDLAGVIRVGNIAICKRVALSRFRGGFLDGFDHRVGQFKRWNGLSIEDFVMYGDGAAARSVPTFDFSTIGLCDSLDFRDVDCWSRAGSPQAIMIDADNGSFVNALFYNVVADKSGKGAGAGSSAVLIRQTAACIASATDAFRVRNVVFNNLRADTGSDNPGGRAMQIRQGSSSGYGEIRGIHVVNPDWTLRDSPAMTVVKTGTDILEDCTVDGGFVKDAASAPITSMFEMGANRFAVRGVTAGFAKASATKQFTNMVEVTDSAITEFVVANNLPLCVSGAVVKHPTYAAASLARRWAQNAFDGEGDQVVARALILVPGETQTIAAGILPAPTNAVHKVDTEAAAATDDVTSIAAGYDGQVAVYRATSSGRVPTFKRGGTGANTLALDVVAGDCPLANPRDSLTLRYDAQFTQWCEISRCKVV